MARKTVFISSTYKDLIEYRKAVWQLLPKFDVDVRGMEAFGARTSGPRETCLAEVEQSDVYVGILAFRLGSIDPETGRSFTELEYERAVEAKKEILFYLASENAAFPYSMVDTGTKNTLRLESFKQRLREKHTIGTFTTIATLVDALKRDFEKLFESRDVVPPGDVEQAFNKSADVIRAFRLTPKRFNGTEVRLSVSFNYGPYAASRELCQRFNLEYGNTIGISVRIVKPSDGSGSVRLGDLYATGNRVDGLCKLKADKNGEIYASLLFSPDDVGKTHAEFFGHSYFPEEEYEPDDGSVYVPPQGTVIMLFSKGA